MPFHFSLQALLRLRISYERLEELRLLAIAALMVYVRREIAAIQAESKQAQSRRERELARGVTGAELHVEETCDQARKKQRESLEGRLKELEKKRRAQQLAFEAARQKRKILENFRQRKLELYAREQARREQQRLDELHLLHQAGKLRE